MEGRKKGRNDGEEGKDFKGRKGERERQGGGRGREGKNFDGKGIREKGEGGGMMGGWKGEIKG